MRIKNTNRQFYRNKVSDPEPHDNSISAPLLSWQFTRPTQWSVVGTAEGRIISESLAIGEVWKTSNRTDKIQHSPFSTETSMLGLANSASLFLKKSKWLWWILEMNRPEQRFFFFFCYCFCCERCTLDSESQSRDSVPQAPEVPWVTGHDFWWWLCQSNALSPGGGNNICWCPGATSQHDRGYWIGKS